MSIATLKLIAIVITIVAFIVRVILWVYRLVKYRSFQDFKVKTIKMVPPRSSSKLREPVTNSVLNNTLVMKENKLRRIAYENTTLETNESFYNDSDMHSSYYLTVVYNKDSKEPLLSARYYFNKKDILSELKGDTGDYKMIDPDTNEEITWSTLDIERFEEGQVMMIDRMSGNRESETYRNYRYGIYLLLYKELYIRNSKLKFFYALARRDTFETLLSKYLRLGMRIVGSTQYHGKDHWVLMGKWHSMEKMFRQHSTFYKAMKWARRILSLRLVKDSENHVD